MTTYVFLGPSLPRGQATEVLDATYLPPIQQGDLLRLLDRGPRHVGIVDGYFETVPSVWHKEILLAMSMGVHVYGAASMGALRAAELHTFGMVGIGTIFAWYRDGRIVADDEVAVQHGPEELGYMPLSQALVDIRDGCEAAVRDGVIRVEIAEAIVKAARELPYWERSCESVARVLRDTNGADPETLEGWHRYASAHTSLKARDACALLTEMRRHVEGPWAPKQVDFKLERTVFFERLRNEVALERALGNGARGIEEEAALESARRAILLRLAAREAAREAGWELSTDALREEAAELCGRLGLTDPDAVRAWLAQESLSEQAFWTYVGDELFIRRWLRRAQGEVDATVGDQLRIARALNRTAQTGGAPGGKST